MPWKNYYSTATNYILFKMMNMHGNLYFSNFFHLGIKLEKNVVCGAFLEPLSSARGHFLTLVYKTLKVSYNQLGPV